MIDIQSNGENQGGSSEWKFATHKSLIFYTKRTLLLFKFYSNKVSDETEKKRERKSPIEMRRPER